MATETDPSNIGFWKNRWETKETGWHMNDINPILTEFLPFLTWEKENQKIFVPLCGKSKDVAYLASLGHRVFGVEGVKEAIEMLNEENSLNLKFNSDNSTYSNADGTIVIYHGDFFTCPYEQFGPFDSVWDRGAFIAIEYPLREKYIQTMRKLLKDVPFRYLMETVKYDKSKFGGPPRSVDEEDIRMFFEHWTEVVDKVSMAEKYPMTEEFLQRTNLEEGQRIVYKFTSPH